MSVLSVSLRTMQGTWSKKLWQTFHLLAVTAFLYFCQKPVDYDRLPFFELNFLLVRILPKKIASMTCLILGIGIQIINKNQ